MFFLIFFSCTDIYIISGVKLVYVFCIPIAFQLLKNKILISKKDKFLFLWYASYFFSIGHIISFSDFVIVLIGQLVLFVIYFYFDGIRTIEFWERCNYWFQKSLYFMVGVGALQLILYYTIGSTWGISHITHGVGLPRMSGLSREPDWYGVICMMAVICMMVNMLNKKAFFNKKADICVLTLSCIMLIFSLTRAAWVGLFVAIVSFLLLKNGHQAEIKRRFGKWLIFVIPIVLVLCVGLYMSGNVIFLKLVQRLNIMQWTANDGGASDSRNYAIQIMLRYFMQHPFTGNGVGSMNAIASDKNLLAKLGYMYSINSGRGNANIIVTNLFDVGLFGTIFLIIFFVKQFRQMISNYRKTNNSIQLSYIMILVGLLVDFQFNNGLRFPFVWIVLGLSSALIRNNRAGIADGMANKD